jgi:hypothetical protein
MSEPRKPLRLGKVQTVDIETGRVIDEREGAMSLLPPAPGVCPDCACDHDPALPHNQQSLYYQMAFHATNGRWPTWSDAMAHCDGRVRAVYREILLREMTSRGVEIPPDLKAPAS